MKRFLFLATFSAPGRAGWTIGKAIEEVVQLNEGQSYSYSREQLIEMLDAAMGNNKN